MASFAETYPYGKCCTGCGKAQPEEAYSRKSTASTGRAGRCRDCVSLTRFTNPAARAVHLQKTREWKARNTSKVKADRKQHYRQNMERSSATNRSRNYGLTPEQVQQMLEAQGGVCVICHKLCKSGNRLAIDHCHTTQKVRGMLCGNCNRGLGSYLDSPELLRRAALYLERATTADCLDGLRKGGVIR